MAEAETPGAILSALGWAYDKAITGIAALDSAPKLADQYLRKPGTRREQANSLIRWEAGKTAANGFVTGLGGFATLPLAVTEDLASSYFIQLRLVAAIAYMGEQDLRDKRIETLAYVCMLGAAASELIEELGIRIGAEIQEAVLRRLTTDVVSSVNERIGARLLARAGERGLLKASRFIPFFGAIGAAALNTIVTNEVGDVARDLFLPA